MKSCNRRTSYRWLSHAMTWCFGMSLFLVDVSVLQAEDVELLFHFGSEKKEWLKEVTDAFNAEKNKDAAGRTIRVKLVPMGSKACVEPLLRESQTGPDLVSPAASVYVEWVNGTAGKPWVEVLEKQLVRSPVVIAMWRERAEMLGWPKTSIGWGDLFNVASNKWPNGEPLKFAHTHPELSASGLMSLLAIAQARTGNFQKLTPEELELGQVKDFVEAIEKSVVYYGESTGFLKDKMIEGGPSAFHAVVMYENLVVAANQAFEKAEPKAVLPRVVAIYPKEGTFISNHPLGFVNREWTKGKESAAKTYAKFLMAEKQQSLAVKTGFRPADARKDETLSEPFVKKNGADVGKPEIVLEDPSAQVIDKALELWRLLKKRAEVLLLIDISGSMDSIDDPDGTPEDTRLARAKAAAIKLINALSPEDMITIATFHNGFNWVQKELSPTPANKLLLEQKVKAIKAFGQTALYRGIRETYRYMKERKNVNKDVISMIVVLSDGEDTRSQSELEKLKSELSKSDNVMLYTFAYGNEAGPELEAVLKDLSKRTEGDFYDKKKAKDVDEFIRNIYDLFGGRISSVK